MHFYCHDYDCSSVSRFEKNKSMEEPDEVKLKLPMEFHGTIFGDIIYID